jgi:hypothetical protein
VGLDGDPARHRHQDRVDRRGRPAASTASRRTGTTRRRSSSADGCRCPRSASATSSARRRGRAGAPRRKKHGLGRVLRRPRRQARAGGVGRRRAVARGVRGVGASPSRHPTSSPRPG